MNIIGLGLSLAILFQVILGGYILLTNKKGWIGLFNSACMFGAGMWALGTLFYFSLPSGQGEGILWWSRFLYFSGFFTVFSFFGLAHCFNEKKSDYKILIAYPLVIVAVAHFIFDTNFIIDGVWIDPPNREILHGIYYPVFFSSIIVFSTLSYVFFFGRFFKEHDLTILKKQTELILFATGPIAVVALVTNIMLPIFFRNFNYIWLGPMTLPITLLIVYYATAKYRFFDVKYALTVITKNIMAFLTAFSLAFLLYVGLKDILVGENFVYLALISTIVLTAFYLKILHFLNVRIFRSHFGSTDFEYFREIIENLLDKNIKYKDFRKFSEHIKRVFYTRLGISSVKIELLKEENKKRYEKIIYYFESNKDPLLRKDLEFLRDEKRKGWRFLEEMGNIEEAYFPIKNSAGKLMGFFILGKKSFDEEYTLKEIVMLERLVMQIGMILTGILYSANVDGLVEKKTEELRESKKELQKSFDELKVLDKEKDSFIAIASHELRAPMTVIQGYSEFLMSGKFGTLTTEQEGFLKKIFGNTKHLLEMVNDITDISKLDAEKMPFEFEKVNLTKVMEDSLKKFYIICRDKKIDLQLSIDKKVGDIKTDPKKINKIISNLVSNAYKQTPELGKIFVSVKNKGNNRVQFEVIDSGMGIPRKDQEAIFHKFPHIDGDFNRQYDGTGLGLPIVRKIVEKLGGDIHVDSREGKGSKFVFTVKNK